MCKVMQTGNGSWGLDPGLWPQIPEQLCHFRGQKGKRPKQGAGRRQSRGVRRMEEEKKREILKEKHVVIASLRQMKFAHAIANFET